MAKMTTDKLTRAIALRAKSWSVKDIAADLGLSHGCVQFHLLKQAVEPPKPSPSFASPVEPIVMRRGGHLVRLFTQAEDLTLLDLVARGIRVSSIAQAMGRPQNSVRCRLMTLARREERAESGRPALPRKGKEPNERAVRP